MFANCIITKVVKKSAENAFVFNSYPSIGMFNMPISTATKMSEVRSICWNMSFLMMKSLFLRGGSCMTLSSGLIEANAIAAKVSMMMFTHSICITVRGGSWVKNTPVKTTTRATILIVNWNIRKRCMLR